MILGIFVLQIALTTKGQGLRAMILAGLCLAVFGVVSLTFPEVAQTMVERLGEFTLPGTSGYERFVTPFLAMSDVLHVAPWSIVTGIGPGAAEELTLPYVYGLNSPIKIIFRVWNAWFSIIS